jgi:hypothetical protein
LGRIQRNENYVIIRQNIMQFWKALLVGLVPWMIMFALGSVLMATGLPTTNAWFTVIMTVLLIVVLWLLVTKWYRPVSAADAWTVGLIWLVIALLLDYFVLVRYFMPLSGDTTNYYGGWGVWAYYAITLFLPPLSGVSKR